MLLTRPARGAAVRWDLPPPRETHRRTRVRVDGDRVVARLHQVFFNASYQEQEAMLLVPDPGPQSQAGLEVRNPSLATPPAARPVDAAEAATLARAWALAGGSPSPLARPPGPALAFGPFPLPRGAYLKVDWRFETRLPTPPGGLRTLVIGSGVHPEKPLVTHALELDLPAPLRSHAFSPTHRLLQREGETGRVVLEPVSERLDPAAPFILLWPPEPGVPGALRGSSPEGSPQALLLVPPAPPPATRARRCWVVALDCGGSLRGSPFAEAVRRVGEALDLLDEGDLFDLVPFSVYPQPFQRYPVAATPENKRRALEFLRRREPLGAVNFEAAVLTALEIAGEVPQDRERAVLLFTDGRPTLGDVRARALLEQHPSAPAPVFPVASGADTDYFFLEQLARLTGGTAIFHEPEEDPIRLIRARVRPGREDSWTQILVDGAPLVTPAEFRYDGPRVVTFAYRGSPTVHIGPTRIELAKVPEAGRIPFLVHRARELGTHIWDALQGGERFPGGALSFRLLGLVPGTPRPRILHTMRDGVGPLGRARMLALQGLLDQGTFHPVIPGPQRTWSGNRFFTQDADGRWIESGLPLEQATLVDYGSAEHARVCTAPELTAHLGLDRAVALFTAEGEALLVRPRETP